MARQATWDDYQLRVTRAIQYLEQHLDDDLSLPELASIASFSPFHFHRIFRALTGEGVAEHVRRLRLERAAARLRNTSRSMLEIALKSGYQAHESFTRAFEAAFHASPSAYRTQRTVLAPPNASADPPETVARTERIGPLSVVRLRHVPEVTPPECLRYDAAFTLPRSAPGEGEIQSLELPARDYVTMTHKGPYAALPVAYAGLIRWWLRHGDGEISDAPALEFYLNHPGQTAPESLLTRICIAIAR